MTARSTGAWLLVAAAVIGLVAAALAYSRPGSGVDHTGGALLVVVSTALLGVAAAVLALVDGPRWLRLLLTVLSVLDLVCTAAAAWFLHAWVLLAMMFLGGVAWLMLTAGRGFSAGGQTS